MSDPCPDGESCPDARRYGDVHPRPETGMEWLRRQCAEDLARRIEELGGNPRAPDIIPLVPEPLRKHSITEVRDALVMAANVHLLIEGLQAVVALTHVGRESHIEAAAALKAWDKARKTSSELRHALVFPRG